MYGIFPICKPEHRRNSLAKLMASGHRLATPRGDAQPRRAVGDADRRNWRMVTGVTGAGSSTGGWLKSGKVTS